ncbi:MAG: reductive dehalogenase [Chloroflexi bacterium]|nr:reductive dehalogenase [Chloroflexota bacterium]
MKKLTIQEWEEKYQVAADKERFDSKYGMFNRPMWDPELKDRLKSWGFLGDVKDKAGYTLQDQALRWGARRGTLLSRFKTRLGTGPAPGAPPQATPAPGGMAMASVNPIGTATAVASRSQVTTATEAPGRQAAMAPDNPSMPMNYKPPEGARINTSNPQAITRDIKKVARYFGADLVGICKLDRRFVYLKEEIPEEFQYAIVMAFGMEYDLLKYFPSYIADAATSMGYSDMAVTNTYLAAFIENLGFKAIDSGNDTALSIPLAIQAGLGEHGRLGLLVTPQFGPRIRLSKIITDLPLVPDSPIDFGVTEFCAACKKCARLCPSQSIPRGDRTTEPNNASNSSGELKWRINAETCRMYWGRVNKPCTACIACCPYNKPNTWQHRTVRWFTDRIRWADPLYIKMDDLFGYGKPHKADKFWEEWQP